jgi:tetratricopeptide (TPR) repeat protein
MATGNDIGRQDTPDSPEVALVALLNEGLRQRSNRCYDTARLYFARALAHCPSSIPAQLLLAESLIALDRFSDVLPLIQALPETRQGLLDAARLRWKLGAAALQYVAPDRASCLAVIDVLMALGVHDAALMRADILLKLDAGDHEATLRRGDALLALGHPEAALDAYAQATQVAPNNPLLLYNRALGHRRLGDVTTAQALFKQAFELCPDFAEAEVEWAHCLLCLGRFTEAWPRYEARWRTAQMRSVSAPSAAKQWRGESLAGKRVLLWQEQGHGDTLQFLRFVAPVMAVAAHTTLMLAAPLADLVAAQGWPIEVVVQGCEVPVHDVHCPLMSLPMVLGVGDQITHQRAYLQAPEAAPPMLDRDKPLLGVAWSGRIRDEGVQRNMRLAELRPLFDLPANFVSLQQRVPLKDQQALSRLTMQGLHAPLLSDFAETAAWIAQLDLVITVDCVIAHLAGALGKPVWIMLPQAAEWRWQQSGSQSLWYASARLFR